MGNGGGATLSTAPDAPASRPGTDRPPAVSVVIPLYNKAPYVAAAVRSVLAQTEGDLELIVVDDGSTDGGAEAALAAADRRLCLIRQANAGAGAARNAGIEAARGRWVAFLDADDTWRPERLARQLELFERHPALVWGAGAYLVSRAGEPAGRPAEPPLEPAWFAAPEVVADALRLLAAGRRLWTGTVMVRREVLRTELFEPTLRTGQDLDLWVRLALRHPRLGYLTRPFAHYRAAVDGSLSERKFEDGFAANLELARRLVARGRTTDRERTTDLHRIARRLVINQARFQFTAGRLESARTSLAALDELGLGAGPAWLELGTRLPAGPTVSSAWRLGRRLRQRLRRLAGHSGAPRSTSS